MISRLIAQLQFTRRGLLSLALLPVFLLGTIPNTACICADGHREEHCRALIRGNAAAKSSSKSGCCCCKPQNDAPSCCQAADHQPQTPAGLIASGSCCHPIIESPAPLAASAKDHAPAKSTLVATLATIDSFWAADATHPTPSWRHLSTPPPIDVVIVYLHLTI